MVRLFLAILITPLLIHGSGRASAGSVPESGEEVRVVARVEPSRIYPDQEATLEIDLEWPGDGGRVALRHWPLPAPSGASVAGRSIATETRWTELGARTILRHRFRLVPEGVGIVRVDTVSIAWLDSWTGRTGTLTIEPPRLNVVRRPPVIGTIVRHPIRSAAGLGLLSVGVGVLVWLWARRRRGRMEEELDLEPGALLEREWRDLSVLARRGELGPFSEQASRAVRGFAEKRYGVAAQHLPTPAIVEALVSKDVSAGVVGRVQEVLSFVDDMRFGLWVPTHAELEHVLGQIERLWADGRDFSWRVVRH